MVRNGVTEEEAEEAEEAEQEAEGAADRGG